MENYLGNIIAVILIYIILDCLYWICLQLRTGGDLCENDF